MQKFLPRIFAFSLMALVQSCGETVNFDTEEKLASENAIPSQGSDAKESPVDEGTDTGEPNQNEPELGSDGIPLACHSEKLITADKALVFPEIAEGTTCAFGQGDNLSRVNGQIRAYLKQTAIVDLPEGAALCGFSLDHEAAAMRYDDEMFFSVNDRLLLATKDYSDYFIEEDGFFSFNWNGLKSQFYDSFDQRPVFCAGGAEGLSSCSVPQTETSGKIKLQFNDQFEAILARSLQKDRSLVFDWITIGDDDDSDCRHTRIDLKLKLRYVNIVK